MPRDQELARAFAVSAEHFLVHNYLPKIERCLEVLNDDQIWSRPNSKANSVGNLILHLCGNARQWIVSGVGDNPDTRNRDEEFQTDKHLTKTELVELLRFTISEVAAVIKTLNAAKMLEERTIQGLHVDVLEAVFHVTEHFSMHTGQIILLTRMFSETDLEFYKFTNGVPEFKW